MPVFEYRALQADGTIAEGQIEAGGRQEALRQMDGRRLRPIRLVERATAARNGGPARATPGRAAKAAPEEGAESGLKLSLGGAGRITARMLENFTRLLSSLLAAGVPLSRALVILHKEASTPAARGKWKEIYDLVVDGMPLADAMGKSPDTFPRVYVAMVEAGEITGSQMRRRCERLQGGLNAVQLGIDRLDQRAGGGGRASPDIGVVLPIGIDDQEPRLQCHRQNTGDHQTDQPEANGSLMPHVVLLTHSAGD